MNNRKLQTKITKLLCNGGLSVCQWMVEIVFKNDKETVDNHNMVLEKEAEYRMDWTYKQWWSFMEKGKKDTYTSNQQDNFENSQAHFEERGLGEYYIHRT